jgi:hypothetical protein
MPHLLHEMQYIGDGRRSGAREMVLDMLLRFGGSGIYKLTGFVLGHPTRKRTILRRRILGFHGYFCCVEKRLRR